MSEVKPIELIWGIAKIARVIGRTDRQTYHLLTSGNLPAKQLGNRWVAERGKLIAFFLEDAE
ncbi:hypothetical protein [Ahrensia marina]|uniref:DNA-binding protein n=1 Tax=Ahrensia marina TaxID=1514904 RepID=A0A0M9GKL6_9HYPH|nr:hypothetical protein [Ahrensia marina]KPA99959.1 hypothetical protein SU32_16265 [Ahrensia marina]